MATTSADPDTDPAATARRALVARRLRGEASDAHSIPPRPAGEPTPLSPAQHGLWVVDRMLTDNALYGVYDAVRLRGPLDLAALRAAFTEVVERHEVLRTVFVERDGEPEQRVVPHESTAFVVRDAAPEQVVQAVGEELAKGFDLSRGPLVRATLLRLAEQDHALLLHLHHIIADEWSCGLLARELCELYRARTEGDAPRLAPVEVQFADYASWLRGQLTPERIGAHLDHWRAALSGVDTRLHLPTDRPRPVNPSYRGAAVRRLLDPELSGQLRDLARQHGTTPFTLMLAVFGSFLSEYAGQGSFAVGSLAAGRGVPQTESSLGLFSTTVAVPFDLRERPSFTETVERTRRQVLDALTHQDVAFEQVISALRVERDPSRNPLFQVMFKYLESGDGRWNLPGVRIERMDLATGSSKMDLTLSATDRGESIELDLNYATDLFREETAAAMLGALEAFTRRVAANPRQPVGAGDVRPASIRQRPRATSRRSEAESRIAAVWTEVLGRDDVDVYDNFFDIGGDSLLAIKIASVGQQRGLPLSPPMLLRHQTIAELATALDGGDPVEFPLAGLDERALDRVLRHFGPDEVEDVYPLSPLQEGMLFTVLADPTGRPYVQEHVYDLQGDVSADALGRAWQIVVDRHPALRSRFLWEGLPHPVQVVCRNLPVRIETAAPAADDGVDLAAPPHRFTLTPNGSGTYRFTWRTHHLLLDGWSRGRVLDEVLAVYEALRSGQPVPELPPVVALRDWVAWREERRRRGDTSFWRQHLQGITEPTPLPFDGPTGGTGGSAVELLVVDDSLARELRDLARRCRVTVGAVVHAAWAVTLYRNGCGPDIVFGTIVNGRYGDLPGLDHVVGMVMNTLPLRVTIDPARPMSELMSRTGVAVAELQSHANSSLVDVKRCSELAAGSTLFDSIFQFEAGPSPDGWTPAGTEANAVPTPIEVGYPLAVGAFLDDRLTLQAQYQRGRMRPQTAANLLAGFVEVLRAAVADPGRVVGEATVPRPAPPVRKHLPVDGGSGDHVVPRTPAERALADIWSQVLRHQNVGIHDNFLALGGDSLLSVRVVALARPVGLTFTSRDVLEQQTIARLIAVTQDNAVRSTTPPLPAPPPAKARYPLAGLGDKETAMLLASFNEEDGGVEDVYRLSPLQLGMLFDRLASPAKDEYFRQYVWEITGALDVDAFVAAWQQVAGRHPMLRACFRWEGLRHPVQVVLKAPPLEVRHLDGRAVPQPDRAAWLDGVLAEDEARGLGLTTPPLRLTLVRTADTEHRLVWTTHHLVIDGWSQQVVLNEVLDLYSDGQVPPAVPFRGYIDWIQRNRQSGADYWRELLSGYRPAVGEPKDDTGWGSRRVVLPQDLVEALRDTARLHRVTSHAVLLGVWGLALTRPDHDDVVFGTVLSGRGMDIPGVERMVGLLLHTVPTRVRVTPDSTLQDWLHGLQSTLLEQQNRPPQSVADIQRAIGLPAGQRLFDAVFTFETPGEDLRPRDGLRITPVEGEPGRPFHPLVCKVKLDADLSLDLEYWLSHHDDAQAARLLDEFARLLSVVAAAQSDTTLAEIIAGTQTASARTSADTLDILADIWARLLETGPVLPEDDYYDLGGDSILAFHVVAEGRRAGLPISIRHINEFPVLADLAAAVDGETPTVDTPSDAGAAGGDIPLTPIQHWFFSHVGNPHHFNQSRQLDLSVRVDESVLARAFQAVVAQHEALRLRCSQDGPAWRQHAAEREENALVRLIDLADAPRSLWTWRIREITDELHQSVHLGRGPLLRAALIRAPRGLADRLAIVIHHFAVDTVSWGIILDDLWSAYDQLASGGDAVLPAATTSLRQWAHHLVAHAGSRAMAEELPRWEPAGPAPHRLPQDLAGVNTESSLSSVETVVPASDTAALVHGAQETYGAPPHVLLLTALARTLAGWSGGGSALIDIEGHGRVPLRPDIDLSRTVGWFTSIHPLTVNLPDPSDVHACVTAVAEAVRCTPHHGVGYGIARYLRGAVSEQRPHAQVAFNYHGRQGELPTSNGWYRFADDQSVARDPSTLRPYLLDVDASIDGRYLQITWNYSTNVHRHGTIQALADRFLAELREIVAAGNHPAAAETRAERHWRLFPAAPAITEARTRHRVAGVSVALLSGGRLAEAWSEGSTRAEAGVPVGPETAYRACSVSKHVTALGVLGLVRRGVLDLESDLRGHLPDLPGLADRPVTLEQLLRHTSGLDEIPIIDTSKQPTLNLVRRADDDFHYSSGNYAVLQRLVTVVTGRPFTDVMQELVLDPLGMTHSSYGDPVDRTNVAVGHTPDGSPADTRWRTFHELAAGGLWTTPTDLARVAQDIYRSVHGQGGVILDRDLALRMLSPRNGVGFGLGTILKPGRGSLWFGHPGDLDTFQCFTAMDVESGDGLVVMANIGLAATFLPDFLAAIGFPIPPAL
ncbi:condensation domain-containing protein [Micromonospora echinofusca]|uniref:Serine hydrolase n=1 Tax=Micromonospora echinofusca TaxID=47858 RepID=A0ABS3VIV6_MICEH|nr:condensation domain-containing protein [Micromonospora echinofusca]MBO4204416.1 serine hydrolase [Micromonospora echinofusca]